MKKLLIGLLAGLAIGAGSATGITYSQLPGPSVDVDQVIFEDGSSRITTTLTLPKGAKFPRVHEDLTLIPGKLNKKTGKRGPKRVRSVIGICYTGYPECQDPTNYPDEVQR